MKTVAATLALVLAGCAVGAGAAQAVTPKKGAWRIKNASVPTKNPGTGFMQVYKKGKSMYVRNWTSPSLYVKCVGPAAEPEEINPGFEYLGVGFSKPFKLGKKAKFGYSKKLEGRGGVVVAFTGRFTSSKKASGTMRVRFTGNPNRLCDSGVLKWTASK
jgi:hypothetical protein